MEVIERVLKEQQGACCRVANAFDTVLNTECVYTFHSPYTTDKGICVHLKTFMGTVEALSMMHTSAAVGDEAMFVRIVKRRVPKEQQQQGGTPMDTDATTAAPPASAAPTKLGIGVDGGFQAEDDKYETKTQLSVVILRKEGEGSDGGGSVPPSVLAEVPYTDENKSTFPEAVSKSVDSVVVHVGMTTLQEVKAWQLDDDAKPVSKYAESLVVVDNGKKISPDSSQWKCEKTGATENLWLNLSTGYVGGGRKNWDGSGGSNGALDHYEDTGKQYPLVVKLGTITADVETADCYSYAADEDGPVQIPNLATLLEKRGINIAAMQKTVKSTAELEVELNATYAFDAITESGCELRAVSGPGLQGLQNLGNSCYMNSILQLLFSGSVPELSRRYGMIIDDAATSSAAPTTEDCNGIIAQHAAVKKRASSPTVAVQDLLVQTVKVAVALTSGIFARPIDDDSDKTNSSTTLSIDATDPKYRLAPRVLKHVVGKDHVDFRTAQQQDAAQFLQYYLQLLDRAELGNLKPTDDNGGQHWRSSSWLFSFETTLRLACTADGAVKYKTAHAPETIWSLPLPMDKAVVVADASNNDVTSPEHKRQKSEEETATNGNKGADDKKEKEPVPTLTLQACLDQWAADHVVDDMSWPHLQGARHAATEQTRLSNFPRYLLLQAQRYTLGPDWAPIKLEVNLDVPEQLDLTPFKSTGPQPGEVLVPEDDATTAAAASAPAAAAAPPVLDEAALSQLMDMGFSLNSCKRALNAVGGSNVEAAMSWVFEHNMDPDFNDPLPEPGAAAAPSGSAAAASGGVDEGVVQSLVASLGCFTADQIRAALQETKGAADRAADWLFSHMDDLDGAIAALASGGSNAQESSSSSSSANKVPLDDADAGKYTLTGLVSHIGKHTGSGHYVVHLKKTIEGETKWVILNDEKVAVSAKPPVPHAYLYLFQRDDTIGAPYPHFS